MSAFSKSIGAILAALMLAACTSVPLTSMPRLAKIDPQIMNLKDVELAVRIQNDFGVKPDTARLQVGIEHQESGETRSELFVFSEDTRDLTKALIKKQKSGYQILRYRLDSETGEDANAFRDVIVQARKEEPGMHKGTLSASVGLCLKEGGNPFKDPRLTLFIRMNEAEDFFTLFKETKTPLSREEQNKVETCEEGT
ncbi:MAG: hypothetical protein AAGB16_07870 [Pseudomonadota bacterium]